MVKRALSALACFVRSTNSKVKVIAAATTDTSCSSPLAIKTATIASMMHCGGTMPSSTAAIATTLVSSTDSSSFDSEPITNITATTHAC